MAPPETRASELDRAMGALLGGALGDALGMPTQSYSREKIAELFGEIRDFEAPPAGHPIAHGLVAASITDDTEQTLLLADHILASPDAFDERGWAQRLLDWERSVKQRGLHDLLGPSTKRAMEALLAGTPPWETGRSGDTNGAAMRIAPVGISTPVEPLSSFTDMVAATNRITHNTIEANASAAAVAAAVSAGIDGAGVQQAIDTAIAAAQTVERKSADTTPVSQQLELAVSLAENIDGATLSSAIDREIGTSVASVESVPAAFALFKHSDGDAWKAGLLAANLGGDTDTIGAIAAGMCGAVSGLASMPQDKIARLVEVNDLDVEDVATGLLELRRARAAETVVDEAS